MKNKSCFFPGVWLFIISIFSFPGCSTTKVGDDLVLQFERRGIDISPYFKDFPFSRFSVSKDGGRLLFFKTEDSTKLKLLEITGQNDFEKAEDVISLDFSQRNCWSPEFNSKDGLVYWIGDEKNDEVINIYRTKPGSNKLEKLTDVPYIYAWSFNKAGDKIAYVARLGQNEERLDELRILDLTSLKDSLITQDNPSFRFTWGNISWQPEDKGVALLALKNADRVFTNVVYVDFASKKIEVLTNDDMQASLSGCQVLDEWFSSEVCYFLSDQSGYANLYEYNLIHKSVKQITNYKVDIDDVGLVSVEGNKYLLIYQRSPVKTTVLLFDPKTNEPVWIEESQLSLMLGAIQDNHVKSIATSTTEIFQLLDVIADKEKSTSKIIMDVPPDIKKKLVNSTVERLEIPTFDIDSSTGAKRLLHAYLYKPIDPLPDSRRLVMIKSFYGGDNDYDEECQILAKAGIYVLSPSPRGSSGFGRDFAAMNDKDLGGNEILDIIYTAKYISERLKIPPERVGVFGMSHGGYATMRLMTFPGYINGHKATFPFGFGIETAGFSDILLQHHTSNIPDWTLLEAGDPVTDSLKITDRSPINHVDKISGPLLLIHGSNDNRVNVEGSRRMAEALKKLDKPYTYVEFSGLGHGIKGIENNRKYYHECFQFLERLLAKPQ